MCGRYTLTASPEQIIAHFGLRQAPDVEARYNIAPTQEVPVVRRLEAGGPRSADLLRWGLVPFWADDLKIGNRMINARAETVATKPAYRASFRRRRCLVPADGFYEWRLEAHGKQPYLFRRRDGGVFAFAGLWDRWVSKEEDEAVESFTILTTDANNPVRPIHRRMPVILPERYYDLWLDPAVEDAERLAQLLGPPPDEELVAVAVSQKVNSPANDDPSVIEPADNA